MVAGLLFGVAPASAAERCAPAVERVLAEVPRYVHAGEPFELVAGQDESAFEYRADNLVAELLGARMPIELPADADTTTLLRAPLRPGPFAVTLTWDQSGSAERPDTPPCTGQRALQVTALPARARIGDLGGARVDGHWKLRITPTGWPYDRTGERFSTAYGAVCDVGACDFFSAGTSHRWRLGGDGRYRTTARARADHCVVTDTGAVLVHGGYPNRVFADLRIVATRRGADGLLRATRMVGEERMVSEPTARARSKGCTRRYVYRWRVTARRI